MHDRRTILEFAVAGIVSLATGSVAGVFPPAASASAAIGAGRVHLVNGWVLTEADLVRLGLHDR